MKQSLTLLGVVLVGVVVFAQQPGPNPEMAAALAKQVEIEKVAPRLQITEEVLPLVVPGHTIGEAVGVAKNSKGHLFVFTRSGATGPAKGATASQLFEFDPALKFVKQWGPDNYAASFAHTVRVDKDDNVWMVDEGSNMVVKFNPQGQVALVLGRKPEAIDYFERFTEEGHKETGTPPARNGVFNRPTDVAWDTEGNIFIADGYNNSRFAKMSKDGTWVGAVGERGAGPNQFNTVHAIANDAKGNIYVADRGNRRIQVYDSDDETRADHHRHGSAVERVHHAGVDAVSLQRRRQRQGLQDVASTASSSDGARPVSGTGRAAAWCTSCTASRRPSLYKGDCSTWTVSKMTIKGGAARRSSKQAAEHPAAQTARGRSRLLPCAFSLLPFPFCLFPSAFCLLPFPFCLLPSAFCLLPSQYRARPSDRQTRSAVRTPRPVSNWRVVDGRRGSSATFSRRRRRVHPPCRYSSS